MIPSIEQIVERLVAGEITTAQAIFWLDRHVKAACGDLRDQFAAAALTGLLANGPHVCDQRGTAHDAYLHADAMLAARAREGEEQ